jgi:selenocysteine lyase/cysteine desulfurase
MEKWGIDFLAFSAHKVYAPFGTGALVVRKGLLNFSTTELDLIRSSGEENAGGIAGLGKALVLLQRIGMDVIVKEEQELTSRALLGLAQIPGLRIYGIRTPVSPGFEQKGGVICFTIKGIMPGRLAKELSLRSGIGVRYGCHCAHLLVKRLLHVGPGLELFQRVLLTLFPKIPLPGILRVSFGIQTTNEELDTLIRVLGELSMNRKILEGRDTVPVQTRKTSLSKARVKRQIMDYVKKASEKVYPQTS